MVFFYLLVAAACVAVRAAPPAQGQFYQHPRAQLQQTPMDYYLDNSDEANYYQSQLKQANGLQNGAPSRLETLEPDSEVELIPGAQSPQQPPQQTPVNPNIPGLIPGQRVFIVHMPVPGYTPGSVAGYQPVYIVAAAPQANAGYPGNGYQNGVLLDPSGQAVASPGLGYPRPGFGIQGANPLVYGGAPLLTRPYDFLYQQQPLVAYQPAQAPLAPSGPLHQPQAPGSASGASNVGGFIAEPKHASQVSVEGKGGLEEEGRNAGPAAPEQRNKA